jgi:hypothetical protein
MCLAGITLLVLFGACGEDGDESPNGRTPEASGGTPHVIGGGGTPPHYAEPVPLTDGDYFPSDFDFQEVAKRGESAAAADALKTTFEGEIAGFRLHSDAPNAANFLCVVHEFPAADLLSIEYLPPGTFAQGPQYAGACKDGSFSFVMQEFATKHGSFQVVLKFGERVFWQDASADRVKETTVDGQPAVLIEPVLDEGFGRSWGALATSSGGIIVDANNLPSSEVLKILEGVRCVDC